jgi:8-oxo-dGTP diphosphatase
MQYIVNVEAAIIRDGKYLLIVRGAGESHAAGLLSFVGGKMEENQNLEDALEATLRREVLEEIGITITNIRYVYNTHFLTDDGDKVLDVVFLCDYESGETRIEDYEEVAEILYLSAEEILEHPKSPIWLKQGIERIERILQESGSS